jgi:membrane protease YdiL (CAAX protease family)
VRPRRGRVADWTLLAGLGLAYGAFALTFRGPRADFWSRMTATGLALGAVSLAAQPELRRARLAPRDLGLGVASAAALYALFSVADRMARHLRPNAVREIDEIYALRSLRPPVEIATRLALVIAPAEELFWRGFVQARLNAIAGRPLAALAATGAYAGAHLVTANLTLIGAAAAAGAMWSALAALGAPVSALIASHLVWDIWIFLLAPTSRGAGHTPSRAPVPV